MSTILSLKRTIFFALLSYGFARMTNAGLNDIRFIDIFTDPTQICWKRIYTVYFSRIITEFSFLDSDTFFSETKVQNPHIPYSLYLFTRHNSADSVPTFYGSNHRMYIVFSGRPIMKNGF